VCEKDFVGFDKDGRGTPTVLGVCDGEKENSLLPQILSLVSQSDVVGEVSIDLQCLTIESSELLVTLNLNDGNAITGDSRISILTLVENNVITETTDVALFSGGDGFSASIPLYIEGTALFELVTEVNGELVTLTTDGTLPEVCFECGRSSAYFADPDGYVEYGFQVNAFSDDNAHTMNIGAARYMHTRLHELYDGFDSTFVSDEVDTCLIIQENHTLTPYSNSGGGNITFSFSQPDGFFEFELFNVHGGATLHVFANDETTTIDVGSGINQVQNIVVDIPETEMVTIEFDGPGAVCGIKSCISATRPPSVGQPKPPFATPAPTISHAPSSIPSESPSGSFYPSSVPSSSPTESVPPSPSPTESPSESPTLVPSYQPTDCYDKYGITQEDIINQSGADEPIPEDAVKIINGENTNVTIEISQLWTNDTDITFFINYHSETHDTICEGISDFSFEDTIVKDLECYDGWTDLGIFIYFDEELTIEECEECRPPEDDDENIVAYFFELPCEPICETIAPSKAPVTNPPTVAPHSGGSGDCYAEYGITEEEIIDQFGSNESLPEDAIKIINGENTNVTIEISQLWSDDTNITFFIHYHSETHDTVCEGIPDFFFEDTIVKDLECYDGWTDLGIFIYLDQNSTTEECEECKPPDSDDDDILAYYFEIPCEPICETLAPTRAPVADTGCFDEYSVTDVDTTGKFGSEEPIPDDAIKIINGDNTDVTIEISQLWSSNASVSLFVQYHKEGHESVCEGDQDFSFQDSMVKDLQCYDGWTDLGIFIYFDDELAVEDCEECKRPDSDDENIVAYYFELPCAPICETVAPSRAPVTVSPSEDPIDCFDRYAITDEHIIDKFGSEEPIPEDAVKIIDGDNTDVKIEISQLWFNDTNPAVFVQYHTQNHGSVCEGIPDVSYEDTIIKDLECLDGWTDLGVFIYFGNELNLEDCEECKHPASGDEDVIAYYFELPCKPICESPAPTNAPVTSAIEIAECRDGIMVMLEDTGGDPMCEYSSEPFFIEELEESGSEVRFSFTNNWKSTAEIDLFYDRGDGEGQQCQSLNSLESGAMYPNTLAASCDPVTKTADIEVYIRNENASHTSSIGKCGEKSASCSYVYKIPCSTDVICGDERRLQRRIEDSIAKGFMTEDMKAAAEPSDETEDTHYCVHEDFPCEGDEENMVYVCHYSSRAGYQTFCIPEMDSDILRFNKNHHCGPCDGWNGVDNNGHVDW